MALVIALSFAFHERAGSNAAFGRVPPRSPQPISPPGTIQSPPAQMTQTPEEGSAEKGFIAAFSKSISFYGRVVDQDGTPISDADVTLAANDKPFGGRPSQYARKSDVDGLFSIEGIKGLTLAIEVSKPGYRVIPPADNKVTSSGLFEYGLSSIRGPYRSDKNTPTVFTLYRPGAPQILTKVGRKNFIISRDGAPLRISLDRDKAHEVIVRCWNNDRGRPVEQRQYDWRLEVTVVNGGLTPGAGIFDFIAPPDGYRPNEKIEMPASLSPQTWRAIVERSYFLRFDDGTFARAKLTMHAEGDHFLTWESFFNPAHGNRNLEGD